MIKSITTRLAAWNHRRETLRELSMLSDRELADLGIGRGDIPSVVAGTLLDADDAFVAAPTTVESVLIGPAWAAHVPTSLAA